MQRIIPNTITAGVNFGAALPAGDYAGWAFVLHLRGIEAIDVAGVPDGDLIRFDASGVTTAEWPPGSCAYAIRATRPDSVVEVEAGRVEILPDLAAQPAGYDGRSEARIALDAINAVLAKRATMDQERYRINNRELFRTPIADLMKLRALYRREVAAEDARQRGGGLKIAQVKVVMGGR